MVCDQITGEAQVNAMAPSLKLNTILCSGGRDNCCASVELRDDYNVADFEKIETLFLDEEIEGVILTTLLQ